MIRNDGRDRSGELRLPNRIKGDQIMRHIPQAYEVYRHFKGNFYQILAIGKSAEDGSEQVVYQALYEPFDIYVRPLAMFMSEVDRAKYPDAVQRYRFEQTVMQGAAKEQLNTEDRGEEKEEAQERPQEETEPETQERPQKETEPETQDGDLDADETLPPLLLAFLDSDTYEEKLRILTALHDTITQDMINTIAMALDIEVAPGELEERYDQVKSCLIMFERYECNRLR